MKKTSVPLPAQVNATASFLLEQSKSQKGKENATKPVNEKPAEPPASKANKGGSLTPQALIQRYCEKIAYSEKYEDEVNEYRHVTLPKKEVMMIVRHYASQIAIAPTLKKLLEGHLLTEAEWRAIGVQQSIGWIHYGSHRPEPHILLFRRPKQKDPSAITQKIEKILIS